MSLTLKVKKLRENAKLPTKAHLTDAGWDLYWCPSESMICVNEAEFRGGVHWREFETGIALVIPKGYCAVVHGRSSLALGGYGPLGGVIDQNYTGELKVFLSGPGYDNGGFPLFFHHFKPGDKIAQILILPVPKVEIEEINELPITDRGEKGYGSSGR